MLWFVAPSWITQVQRLLFALRSCFLHEAVTGVVGKQRKLPIVSCSVLLVNFSRQHFDSLTDVRNVQDISSSGFAVPERSYDELEVLTGAFVAPE